MSIHERDWYREDYADKNGLRYDRRTATYAAKDQHVDASISVDELPSSDGPARVSPHWSLQLVVWLVLALALAAFFSLLTLTIYGYARVSTLEQNTAAQLAAFRRAGIDKVVQEKRSAVKQRPELDKLLTVLVKGDVLVVYKLDRLARSVSHFVKVFEYLKAKGVGFRSLTESIETDTAHGRMFLHLLSAFAEFERELIRERCLAGQRAARAAGKTWGRKRALSDDDVAQAAACWRSGWYDQRTLADMLGVSISSLRDHIHRHEGRGRWAKTRLQK